MAVYTAKAEASRLWINHVLDRTMRSRVRSTRKKPEVFKWKKYTDDFFHGQLERLWLAMEPGGGRCETNRLLVPGF